MENKNVSQAILRRLPIYLNYLKSLPREEVEHISSVKVAEQLGFGDVQVRKDLASVCKGGKPKVGYVLEELINDLEVFLGSREIDNAIVIGAGKLGGALLDYKGFDKYGLNVIMAFDIDNNVVESNQLTKKVKHLSELNDFCKIHNVKIGIITTPAENAQEICDLIIECGVMGIMNFTTTQLKVPNNVLVQNIDIASMLALIKVNLSKN